MPPSALGRATPARDLTLFTICASNYLAHACVLGASVVQHHGMPLVVFLLDAPPSGMPLPDCIEIVLAEGVFTRAEWSHRRCHYSILEFATSVKPACFQYLFGQGASRAMYIDPDIRLFRPIDFFWHESADTAEAELVLTPHVLTPPPDDGCMPDDLAILRAGIYNLGFAAMKDSERTRELLRWWDHKLHTLCLEDVRTGVFTDQKWMDYAPLMVPRTAVLRHCGCNTAYWNLHERTPRRRGDDWWIESNQGEAEPLVFFHFSGFNPDVQQLSRHETRFGWTLPGDGQALFETYAQDLKKAGIAKFRAVGPPKVAFADGTPWDAVCRELYRESVAQRVELGDPLADPDFLVWAESAAAGDHVNRYSRALLRVRSDLVEVFDDGHDAIGLMAWMRTSGLRETGLSRKLVERLGPAAKSRRPGANYVGYLRSHLGVGEAARNSVAALDAAGVSVFCHDISGVADAPTGAYELPGRRWPSSSASATILGCNADMLPSVLAGLPMELLESYRIGCWYWETPSFPDAWTDRFELVDEIWAGTQFIAEAIRAKTRIPVLVMPPMVMPPPVQGSRPWLMAQLPDVREDEFVFLFQFDVASVPFRKNPDGVINAFSKAFHADEPVRLIVKALNAEAAPELMAQLRAAARGRRVSFMTRTLESADRFRLLASMDAFVSLHRSEGFGLSIAEAMAYGIPVVVTQWSGNVDFTNHSNAAVVPFDLVRSKVAHGPYTAGTVWAEPRIEVAGQLMRRLWVDRAWRVQIAQAGQRTIASTLSGHVVGSAMHSRLQQVTGLRRGESRMLADPLDASAAAKASERSRSLTVRVFEDALRFPGYYLARVHRVPWLLWRLGLAGTLQRADVVASAKFVKPGDRRASSVWTRLRRLLRLRTDARRFK